MTSEAQKNAVKKYKQKVKRFSVDFHPTEMDLFEHLEKQDKKQTYIKNLIRQDMKGNNNMNNTTMKAIVKGTSCNGEAFVANLEFTMIPPKDGEDYYGTGYYMMVEETTDIFPKRKDYCDVRYERTTDIKVLADMYIKNYYGKNAEEVFMEV